MNDLTLEEQATNFATLTHIMQVRNNLDTVVKLLLDRGKAHDASKLLDPEVEAFTRVTARLSALTYGSKEFNACKEEIAPALVHHYANNRHHPEHFKAGIDGMNLIDLIEMFCDWAASCKRHNDGNLNRSLEINTARFNMSPQLVKVLENSVHLFE